MELHRMGVADPALAEKGGGIAPRPQAGEFGFFE